MNYDCCGGGCADCDLRIYQRELARWNKLRVALPASTCGICPDESPQVGG